MRCAAAVPTGSRARAARSPRRRGRASRSTNARSSRFTSNDYLGLANHPAVVAAARDAAANWGVGAGASHVVCGHMAPHAALEDELAAFVAPCAGARALTFSSGYLQNLAILTALAGRGDAVFGDRLNHACLNDGALLSRAQFIRYAHGDADALAARLAATRARRKIIATDAVFSMDGDLAPLARLLELADAHDAWLVVDDAHGFGVLGEGRGSVAHCRLASDRIVYMGTLGKAAGGAGAHRRGPSGGDRDAGADGAPVHLHDRRARARRRGAAGGAVALIREGRARRDHLAALVARFRDGARALRWPLLPSQTAIQPLVVGDSDAAVALSGALAERGILVPAIRPPTVPAGTARLRISLSAAHRADDVDALLAALHACAS